MDPDKLTAVQAVLDRVSSWQETATEGTVESEVREGLDEVGIDLTDDDVAKLTRAIEDQGGEATAEQALG